MRAPQEAQWRIDAETLGGDDVPGWTDSRRGENRICEPYYIKMQNRWIIKPQQQQQRKQQQQQQRNLTADKCYIIE